MRIRVINPVVLTSVDWKPLMERAYAGSCDSGTELDFVFLEEGIESPEQHFWEDLQMSFLVRELERTDQEAYHGVIIFCAADPGVTAAKECLKIPVVGLLESSVALASLLGRRFSWLSPLSRGNGFVYDRILQTGRGDRLASIRAIEVPVVRLSKEAEVREKALREGRRAVEEDGADVLIVGCTGMMGLAEGLQHSLGVPVIDAGVVGIRMCELLIKTGLCQSKKAFPSPRSEMGRRLPALYPGN